MQGITMLFLLLPLLARSFIDPNGFRTRLHHHTELFGVGQRIRRTFSGLRRSNPSDSATLVSTKESKVSIQKPQRVPSTLAEPFRNGHSTRATPHAASVSTSVQALTTKEVAETESTPSKVQALTLNDPETSFSISDEPLYTLPPITEQQYAALTPLETEFRSMILHFANYTERDMLSLRDPRMRILFEGVAASADIAPVYRAFEVLFEDLLPLRVAGRLVYKRLDKFMKQSVKERQEDVATVAEATELPTVEVEMARCQFVSVAATINGDAYLTTQQLEQSHLADVATDTLGYDTAHDLLDSISTNRAGRFTFVELLTGLRQCAEDMCAVEACNPAQVTHKLLHQLAQEPPLHATSRLDARRRRHSDRYDEMLTAFRKWEAYMPTGEGSRRMDVVQGCFHGAESPPIVEALRVVYCDYQALRVAGDLIFALVNNVMTRQVRKAERQRQRDEENNDR